MSEALTYSSLSDALGSYTERVDAKFIAQIPKFIMLAENRLASDMKQQGFQSVVSGTTQIGANGSVIPKPAFWRETISFTYKDPVLGWVPIRLRALEYLKNFWPIITVTQPPRFYADYNSANFLVAPSPDQVYPFELAYYARLQPLDATNQKNWLTDNAPQTLLYAALLEASLWRKNDDDVAKWQAQYNDQRGSIMSESDERISDRTEVVTRA